MAKDPTDTRQQKSASARPLLFLGFTLLATGVGFAAAPHYSWQVTKIARQAAEFGVQSGVLMVGGLVLLGLGLVARSVVVPRHEEPVENPLEGQLHLLNEQVSAKLGQLRTSLLQLSENMDALAAQQQAHFQTQSETTEGPNHQQDALFRLAASLDKLNAHFDERIHGIDLQLRSGFESMASEIRRLPERRPEASAPARLEPVRHDHGQAPEGAIDFYETMQKLDAIAGGCEPRVNGPRPRQQPPAPFPVQGSEALDALLPDDFRKPY